MSDKKKVRIVRNRKMVLSLEDVLAYADCLSKSGHPHDYINEETSVIRLECSMKGRVRIIIEWEGFPQDNPEYGTGY